MRVRMLTTAAGPSGGYHAGDILEMSDREAEAVITHGYGEAVDLPEPEALPEPAPT